MSLLVTPHDDALQFAVKAVPGASRDRIVGLYGEALKVQVAAPAEGGKANARILEVLAATLGLPTRDVVLQSGAASPRKVVAVRGIAVAELEKRLMVSVAVR